MLENWSQSLQSLTLFYRELLLPLKDSLPDLPAESYLEREEDPLWHLGHACFDCARALIFAFDPKNPLVFLYDELFLGLNARHPWGQVRPGWEELILWWERVLGEVEEQLPRYDQAPLSVIVLDRYPLHTARQAWDYALFHTGFHLGRVHQLLGW